MIFTARILPSPAASARVPRPSIACSQRRTGRRSITARPCASIGTGRFQGRLGFSGHRSGPIPFRHRRCVGAAATAKRTAALDPRRSGAVHATLSGLSNEPTTPLRVARQVHLDPNSPKYRNGAPRSAGALTAWPWLMQRSAGARIAHTALMSLLTAVSSAKSANTNSCRGRKYVQGMFSAGVMRCGPVAGRRMRRVTAAVQRARSYRSPTWEPTPWCPWCRRGNIATEIK